MPTFAKLLLLLAFPVIAWDLHAESTDRLTELLALYNQHSDTPLPSLTEEQLGDLEAGETVLVRDRSPLNQDDEEADHRIRATGFKLFTKPRRDVWLSTLYKGGGSSLKEHTFSMGDRGDYILYQFLELPWPIRDRHWTIDVSKSVELANKTDQVIWEHGWKLAEGGEDFAAQIIEKNLIREIEKKDFDRAIYLPVNRGGWIAMELSADSTLLVAHTTTVMSGWIPNRFVALYTTRTLDRMIEGIDEFADDVEQKYDHRRFPVFTGNGVLIESD